MTWFAPGKAIPWFTDASCLKSVGGGNVSCKSRTSPIATLRRTIWNPATETKSRCGSSASCTESTRMLRPPLRRSYTPRLWRPPRRAALPAPHRGRPAPNGRAGLRPGRDHASARRQRRFRGHWGSRHSGGGVSRHVSHRRDGGFSRVAVGGRMSHAPPAPSRRPARRSGPTARLSTAFHC